MTEGNTTADAGRSLRQALRFFTRLVDGGTKLKAADNSKLEDLLNGSKKLGLEPDEILLLVDVLTNELVPKTKMTKLMKCLLPKSVIPVRAVTSLLSWMNTEKADLTISSIILQWIHSILDFIDNIDVVHRLYFVYFQMLKVDRLRRHAANLLTFLTKSEDVQLYRVNRLLRLRVVLGNDRSIVNLLLLYKSYCPHLVTVALPNTQPLALKLTWWTMSIQDLRERNVFIGNELTKFSNPKLFWQMEDSFNIRTTARKRKLLEEYLPSMKHNPSVLLLPSLKSSDKDDKPFPLDTISSKDQLFRYFDRLMLPAQSLTVLRYPILHGVASTFKNAEFINKLNYRLDAILYLDFATFTKGVDLHNFKFFLARLDELSDFFQEGNPVVENFLAVYLPFVWNGRDHAGRILSIITRLRLRDFADMEHVLLPIRNVFCSSDVNFKIIILDSLTALVNNIMTRELSRNREFDTFFVRMGDDVVMDKALQELLDFINELCVLGVISENGNQSFIHKCLDFYKLVIQLPLNFDVAILMTPPPAVVYSAFFSVDPYALSRVCSLLYSWSEAYEKFKDLSAGNAELDSSWRRCQTKDIPLFNAYIADFCDGLWRLKAFTRHDPSPRSIFNLDQDLFFDIDVGELSHAFIIPRHPALIGLARSFSSESTKRNSNKTNFFMETSLRSERVTDFRRNLNKKGLSGVSEFLERFVRDVPKTV